MTSFFALLKVLSHSVTVAGIARVKEIFQGYLMTPVSPRPNTSFSLLNEHTIGRYVSSIATEAYTITLRSLQQALLYAEMTQIQVTLSVKDLHNVATEAQYLGRGGRGRIRSMVETLNQYSGVPDIVSQWHPKYSAPAWGTLKWLLVIR